MKVTVRRSRAMASLAGDRNLADDLVQDTVVLALRAEDQFTPGTSLRVWLFTILRNRFSSLLRGKSEVPEAVENEGLTRTSATPAPQRRVRSKRFDALSRSSAGSTARCWC